MTTPLDLAGLGIGPFNLSIAALLRQVPALRTRFFDSKPQFSWHPGMMLPGVRLQTSFLKDLVTGVAPYSHFSFLNYLVQHGRFYAFMNAQLSSISREEYADYLSWVAGQLDSLEFGAPVEAVDFVSNRFEIHLKGQPEPVLSHNLCLGTGKTPSVPQACRPALGANCFHAIEMAQRRPDVSDKRVAVVGGGQSGAEIALSLLQGDWGRPQSLTWVSRRANFEPLDETAFTNEYFTPQYVETFHGLSEARKRETVERQKLASDGISPQTLQALYQWMYESKVMGRTQASLSLKPHRTLLDLKGRGPFRLTLRNGLDDRIAECEADLVILCTGFESRVPACLEPLQGRLSIDSARQFQLGPNFDITWDGPRDRKIYAVNAGRHSHGIAEPQMSLMCWRSARIINDLAGEGIFPVHSSIDMVDWTDEAETPREMRLAI